MKKKTDWGFWVPAPVLEYRYAPVHVYTVYSSMDTGMLAWHTDTCTGMAYLHVYRYATQVESVHTDQSKSIVLE